MDNNNTTNNKTTNDFDCSRCKFTSPGCLAVLCELGGGKLRSGNYEE